MIADCSCMFPRENRLFVYKKEFLLLILTAISRLGSGTWLWEQIFWILDTSMCLYAYTSHEALSSEPIS